MTIQATAPTTAAPVEPRAYRVRDALRLLGISASHFYALRAAGKIKTISLGGRTLVSSAEIARLLAEGA